MLFAFQLLASSIPIITFIGVGAGVGFVFGSLLLSISRNPSITNELVK
jgi:F0F1-type ATP synthase membrane subunit c/vacuolar-type H+-ATPase subunit K